VFHNVIVGVDGRPGGHDAIALAQRLAAPDATVTLVNVYMGQIATVPSVLAWEEVAIADATALLHRERARAGTAAHTACIAGRSPAEGLHRCADRMGADLLVVGSSHRGPTGRAFIGDDARASLNGAPCAIATAPQGYATADAPYHRIGVGYDSSDESRLALTAAKALAARDDAQVEVLHAVHVPMVLPPTPGIWMNIQPELMEHAQAELATLEDVSTTAVVGPPGPELSELSRRVDLLVVGSRSYGPLRRMLIGSTAGYLQRHAACPLLVVPRSALRTEHEPERVADDAVTA
jgi:nucleotide-binding universal stress UspA family protein